MIKAELPKVHLADGGNALKSKMRSGAKETEQNFSSPALISLLSAVITVLKLSFLLLQVQLKAKTLLR